MKRVDNPARTDILIVVATIIQPNILQYSFLVEFWYNIEFFLQSITDNLKAKYQESRELLLIWRWKHSPVDRTAGDEVRPVYFLCGLPLSLSLPITILASYSYTSSIISRRSRCLFCRYISGRKMSRTSTVIAPVATIQLTLVTDSSMGATRSSISLVMAAGRLFGLPGITRNDDTFLSILWLLRPLKPVLKAGSYARWTQSQQNIQGRNLCHACWINSPLMVWMVAMVVLWLKSMGAVLQSQRKLVYLRCFHSSRPGQLPYRFGKDWTISTLVVWCMVVSPDVWSLVLKAAKGLMIEK